MKMALDPCMHRDVAFEASPAKVAELGHEWIDLSGRAEVGSDGVLTARVFSSEECRDECGRFTRQEMQNHVDTYWTLSGAENRS